MVLKKFIVGSLLAIGSYCATSASQSNIYQKSTNWVMKAAQPIGSEPEQVYLQKYTIDDGVITPVTFQGYSPDGSNNLWVLN